MNTTLTRGALVLGVAVTCAVMLCAAAVGTSRTAHADPGDNGGFDGYRPSDWDDVIAYLEAIAANEAAPPPETAPAPVAPPAAAIEAPGAIASAPVAAAPIATAAASPARVLLPNAGAGAHRAPAPLVATITAITGLALMTLGWRRRRVAHL